jgi:Domain of unknown function (DUF4864)
MQRILIVVMLGLAMVIGRPARADGVDAAATAAIQGIIESQLQAMAADREAEAYSYAAPLVQGVFPTAEQFMAMVKRGYQPVYRNTSHRFSGPPTEIGGRLAQRVMLQGADGQAYEADYFMQQQEDGSWKISGCVLVPVKELGV